jgi:hypothetical protein
MRHGWLPSVAFFATLAAPLPGSAAASDAPRDRNWALRIDDDWLAPGQRDADYTAGVAYTLGAGAGDTHAGPRWLARTLDWTDDVLRVPASPAADESRAFEIGVQVFTPRDLTAEVPLPDDRPYATLLYAASSQLTLDEARDVARQSTLTLGVLGLPIVGELHRALHEGLGSPLPNGYDHQISDGGEPTFRYAFASQHLLTTGAHAERPYAVRFGFGASAGYITEANVEIAARSGPERDAWWRASPPSSDYAGQPPFRSAQYGAVERGVVLEGGLALEVRVYNTFLQGQARHSDVTFASGELNHVLIQAWFGLSTELTNGLEISYTLRWSSPEIAAGAGSRSFSWGSLSFARRF